MPSRRHPGAGAWILAAQGGGAESDADTAATRKGGYVAQHNDRAAQGEAAEMICIGRQTRLMPGGCQVPSPAGRMDGASFFGQYRRITR